MSQTDLRRLSKRFSTTVQSGSSGEISEEISAPATIERCDVRFYVGPQLDLELIPFVRRGENSRTVPLPDLNGRDVIVGEDDAVTFHVSEPVSKGDEIGVEYENKDGSHAYDFNCDILLERAGGQNRVLGGDA